VLNGLNIAPFWARGAVAAAAAAILSFTSTPAFADRCSSDAQGSWSCAHSTRTHSFKQGNKNKSRTVRWQVPEGTPPAGGWPVAFFFIGWTPSGTNPFTLNQSASGGGGLLPQIFHELLDDPNGTGIKYAVIAAEPPFHLLLGRFWNTNEAAYANNYAASEDYALFPDLFGEIKTGSYGAASQYNMNKRFAVGHSSGGYNTSRMAVNFNQAPGAGQGGNEWGNLDTWKTLAILSGSYATCMGSTCSVPVLPSNHPTVKFWHGYDDTTVPQWTAELYEDELQADGKTTAFLSHNSGHSLDASMLGATGVKAWFDLHN
jgi:hypothetical protein